MDPEQLHQRLDLLLRAGGDGAGAGDSRFNSDSDISGSDRGSSNNRCTAHTTTSSIKRRRRRRSLELVAAATPANVMVMTNLGGKAHSPSLSSHAHSSRTHAHSLKQQLRIPSLSEASPFISQSQLQSTTASASAAAGTTNLRLPLHMEDSAKSSTFSAAAVAFATTISSQDHVDARESASASATACAVTQDFDADSGSDEADTSMTTDTLISCLPPPTTSTASTLPVGTSLLLSQQQATITATAPTEDSECRIRSTESSISSSPPAPVTPRKLPKLSLSAYKRPEQTVRLTGDYWNGSGADKKIRQLEDEYDLRGAGCKVIGHGAFSTVRSARSKVNGRMVAVKSISKFDALRARRLRRPPPPSTQLQQSQDSSSTSSSTSNDEEHRHHRHHHLHHHHHGHLDEWEVLRLMQKNPYVLTLFDVFETDEEIHLVTEYCKGGELFHAIQRRNKTGQRQSFRRPHFSEPQAARITYQVLKALVELHSKGIVHTDIKAENILLLNDDESDIQIKLCDFGMARFHYRHHQHSTSNSSTTTTSSSRSSSDGEASPSTPGVLLNTRDPTNIPPEGCNRNCGPAGDMYSLGVMLYILLCGFPPVFCNYAVEFPDAYWYSVSEEAKELVQMMLIHDPCSRITAADAVKKAWVRQQTTRGRRGSISANLELVRSRLMNGATSTNDTILSPKRRRSSLGGGPKGVSASGGSKRLRRDSLTLNPMRSQKSQSIELSVSDLYAVSETVPPGAKTVAACP